MRSAYLPGQYADAGTGQEAARPFAPRVRPDQLDRPRLFRVLDAMSSRELTLVTAPAGFGKTVLVESYCAARPDTSVAWLSLDPADDDPVYLWTNVASALDQIQGGLGRRALVRLSTSGVPVHSAVDELINGLMSYERPIVIVLDDLHAVRSDTSLASIERAIKRLPPHIRLIATTRSNPAMHLGRLRGLRLLGEIRAKELAFTMDEARELLVDRAGIELGETGLEMLLERTEGWHAGVYLAALWLRDQKDPNACVRDFGASHRYIAEYLVNEVLESIDPDERSFLVRTASLGRFTPELSDFALGRDDSAARIGKIERANLFLVSLDPRGEWFRYHNLFAELLSLELKLSDRAAGQALHRRAAQWCLERGLVVQAVEHMIAAGDSNEAATTLSEHHLDFTTTNSAANLLDLALRLPTALLVQNPALAVAAALAAGLCSRPARERRRLVGMAEQAQAECTEKWTGYPEVGLALARAIWADGDVGAAVTWGRRAVSLAQGGVPQLLVLALAGSSRAHYLAGDFSEARGLAETAVDHTDAGEHSHGLILAMATMALIDVEQHHRRSAEAKARRAVEVSIDFGVSDLWTAGQAYLALGWGLAAVGKLREAERAAERGLRIVKAAEGTLDRIHACLVLAEIRISRARLDQAAADLYDVWEDISRCTDPGRFPALAIRTQQALDTLQVAPPELLDLPSQAELAVLALLCTDLSLREIGQNLGRSLNTIKTHTRKLYRKLGVSTRADAVMLAAAHGLTADGRVTRVNLS